MESDPDSESGPDRFRCQPETNQINCALFRLMEQSCSPEKFVHKLHTNSSYLSNGQFARLACLDPVYCDSVRNLTHTRSLFRCIKISFIARVDEPVIAALFMFIKKNYNMIRVANWPNGNVEFTGTVNYDDYSFPVVDCLDFIKKFFMVVMAAPNDNIGKYILAEMRQLLLFVGRMAQFQCQFQEYSFHRRSDADGALYYHFHLTLQIWWTYIEMTYLASRTKTIIALDECSLLPGDDCNDGQDLFQSSVRIFLYDLLAFGLIRFQNGDSDQDDFSATDSPFLCFCFLELFIMIKTLVCQNSEQENRFEEFYRLLFDVMAHFDPANREKISFVRKQDIQMEHFKSVAIEDLAAKDFHRFSLWLWSNLVPLMKIFPDHHGLVDDEEFKLNIPANVMKIYRNLFRKLESQQKDSSAVTVTNHLLTSAMRYTQFLSEPPIDLVILFLDFYLKRLNQRFAIRPGMNLLEMADFTVKNGQRWAQNMTEIIGHSNYRNNDSFKIFLFYIHDQLERLFSLPMTNANKNQTERTITTNYQKIISKIIVTLQPNLIRSLQPAGFYRLGLFHFTLMQSIPADRYTAYSDRLLNPIKELIKEKRSLDFIELIIKFLFGTFHVSTKRTGEQNEKIALILNKWMNNIIGENFTFVDPRKEFIAIMLCYFGEIRLLVQEKDSRTQRPLVINNLEHLLAKIDLNAMFKRFHSLNIHQTDRVTIMETINELLHVTYCTILAEVDGGQRSQQPSTTSNLLEEDDFGTLSPNQPATSVVINGIQPIIESLIPIIKLEAANNDDEIVASLAFNITLFNMLIAKRWSINLNENFRNTNLVEFFLSFVSDSRSNSHRPHCQEYFQLNYLYLLFEDAMIVDQLRKCPLSRTFVSTWCKLMIALPFDEDDDGEQETGDERKKLILISKNIYRTFVVEGAGQQVGSSTDPLVHRSSDDETMAFEQFVIRLTTTAQSDSAGSNRVNLIDQYFRLMVTTAKQMVQQRKWLGAKDIRLLSKLYRYISILVAHLSRAMFVVGKSDCLMVLILENIVIAPPNILSLRQLWPTLFKISLPLIMSGLAKLDQHRNDPYIERKVRQLILSYLPHLTQYLNFDSIKATLSTRENGYQYWKIQMYRVLERVYLVQRETALTKETFDYLDKFCRIELTREDMFKLTAIIFQQNINEFNLNDRDHRTRLYQTIMAKTLGHIGQDIIECQNFIDQVMVAFLKRNAQNRPAKMFEVVKRLLPTDVHRTYPIWVHQFCSRISLVADQLEKATLGHGNQFIVRKLLKDFLSYYENM